MNNDAFRKLVASTPARPDGDTTTARPGALGTKKSAFVPMTPRPGKAAGSDEFARQVREQHAQMRPPKKYKSSAPKGSKFGSGYVDRAKERQAAENDKDDKAERIKALEEQAKLGQIPWETFEALRDKITGGDVSSTHLVKGLDRQLLERVRRGEDVLGTGKKVEEDAAPEVDVDDELEKLGEQEVATVQKEQTEKKGVKAVGPVAGKKRTRDELLAELKAQRQAAAEAKAASAPKLDGRWKKLGETKPKVEVDHKGREVLTVVQDDGTVKKMYRKAAPGAIESKAAVDMPDISKPVLGADVTVPEQKKPEPVEESDDDIFEGAGTEYNPLGDMEDEDDDSDTDNTDNEDEGKAEVKQTVDAEHPNEDNDLELRTTRAKEGSPPDGVGPGLASNVSLSRNYFGQISERDEEAAAKDRFKGIENVLKKAANLTADKIGSDNDDEDLDAATREEREARKVKRAKMLAQQDRDLDDMDLGFGGSRGEDEEDGMDSKVKFAEWKGGKAAGDDGWEEDDGKRGEKKKRKPKKRKGDVNNAADIFRVIEGRKAKDNK